MSKQFWTRLGLMGAALVAGVLLLTTSASANIPPPGPASGSSGLQGTVKTPAPKDAATITTPTNGQSFGKMPITVAGLCTSGLLVKVFSNNVFVGSAQCNNGSYSMQVTLFDGTNELVARIFDALDQPGPDSATVTVTYNNSQFAGGGAPQFTLSSLYALRGANPNEQLNWPIIINGGTAPYALSVDWGDGKAATLYSEPFAGNVIINHTYNSAGTYVVIVKGTDKDGQTAFLQLVGQANGAVTQSSTKANGKESTVITITKVLWIPAALCIPLIAVSFWLGRRYELAALRRHLERPEDD
ncbi:MAG TPA: PKD domain-containing protein [Candidatus Saccharimonadales bacterium]